MGPSRRPTKLLAALIACCAVQCQCSVILQSGNYSFDAMADMPADFGPDVPTEGITAPLWVADPEDACQPIRPPPKAAEGFIALIQRSEELSADCSFDVKVSNAESAGAVAAIVYDDKYEALIIMSKPSGHGSPNIPAVFISQKSGLVLKRLMTPGKSTIVITPMLDAVWLSMLLSASAGMLAVSVVAATFYFIRRQRIRALPGRLGYTLLRGGDDGMTPAELRALPIVMHEASSRSTAGAGSAGAESSELQEGLLGSDSEEGSPSGRRGGGTLRTCAICLEDYRDGNKLRVLPCKHRFHVECIDQWLSARKPLCPICKWDALAPLVVVQQPTEDQAAAAEDLPAAEGASARPTSLSDLLTFRWLLGRRSEAAGQEAESSEEAAAAMGGASPQGQSPVGTPRGQSPVRRSPSRGAGIPGSQARSAALARAGDGAGPASDMSATPSNFCHLQAGGPFTSRRMASQGRAQSEIVAADDADPERSPGRAREP